MESDKVDQCKTHFRKLYKGTAQLSPSKMSKRELEEIYFNTIENNEELKKTVNVQNDKIRMLSTQLLRANNTPKRHLCKSPTKCCSNAYEVIVGLNSKIQDLKQVNAKLERRIQILNMRLCSQKQFKPNSSRTPSKFRIMSSPTSRKTVSAVESFVVSNVESIEMTPKSQKDSHESDVKTVITNNCEASDKEDVPEICDVDVQQLIANIDTLKEELSSLNAQVNELKEGKLSLEQTCIRYKDKIDKMVIKENEDHTQEIKRLNQLLRDREAKNNSISTELAIEKKRVIELNMQLKAASSARQVVSMLEQHLVHITSQASPKNKLKPSTESNAVQTDDTTDISTSVTVPSKTVDESNTETKLVNNSESIKFIIEKNRSLQRELDKLKIHNPIIRKNKNVSTDFNFINTDTVPKLDSQTFTDFEHPDCFETSSQTKDISHHDIFTQTTPRSPLHKTDFSSNRTYTVNGVPSKSSNNTDSDAISSSNKNYTDKDNQSFTRVSRTEDTSATEYSEYSDSYDTFNNYSDGEIPNYVYGRKYENGRMTARRKQVEDKRISEPQNTSQQVEEALKAISIQLNKCNELLHLEPPVSQPQHERRRRTS